MTVYLQDLHDACDVSICRITVRKISEKVLDSLINFYNYELRFTGYFSDGLVLHRVKYILNRRCHSKILVSVAFL